MITMRDENETMIAVKNVNKVFGKKGGAMTQVLNGAELEVKRGEFVSLMGASGSGKSTLLYLIGGLDRDFSGDIQICGQSIRKMSERKLSKIRLGKIGFIFQFYNLVQNLTALENVELASQICTDPLPAADVLAQVGLKDRMDNFPAQLSGGEQQRVAIARALINDPPVILADEPTGNLDEAAAKQVVKIFQDLREKQGKTIVMVTHDSKIAALADQQFKLG